MTHPFKILNAHTRTNEKFYVEFFGVQENVSNVLGRQVKSIEIPEISFETIQLNKGRNKFQDKGKTEHSDISIEFKDDEDSITDMVIAVQLLRQLNNAQFPTEDEREYKFGIRVRKFASDRSETLGFEFNECFITDVTHSRLSYSETKDPSTITVRIAFDGFQFLIPERFRDVLELDDTKFWLPSKRQ